MADTSFDCFDLDKTITAIATALGVGEDQVRATIELLEAGNTIPFIARYRKEATRALDEIALRAVAEAIDKARELAARKTTILKTIDEQGQLTDELRRQIEDCDDKKTLEDLYLPFKPKRRTRATIARERGLQPLADLLLKQERLGKSRSEALRPFVSPDKEGSRRSGRPARGRATSWPSNGRKTRTPAAGWPSTRPSRARSFPW